jgi:hypothetical protein
MLYLRNGSGQNIVFRENMGDRSTSVEGMDEGTLTGQLKKKRHIGFGVFIVHSFMIEGNRYREQIQRDAENIQKGQHTSVLADVFFKIQAEVGRKRGLGSETRVQTNYLFKNRDSEDIPQRGQVKRHSSQSRKKMIHMRLQKVYSM